MDEFDLVALGFDGDDVFRTAPSYLREPASG